MLRSWPLLRSHFRGRDYLPEPELRAFVAAAVPGVPTAAWPVVLQGLVRSQLLHETVPGVLAFEADPYVSAGKPVLAPAWIALWQHLQARLALPLGCLWSTRWLRPYFPDAAPLLVVDVN
ncbi:hypothetical protein [Hymenobacter edaphi]|uniref:Uncharacterized protein n=1 Tax=Hymenobacter edaphi TaxID=2211146 RepID=A0A328B7G7_9BACT|nr:hypothetical protein [Hymenobacter edaphi]RAK62585.1 hypothetical protein DLM85_23130 [Hymenobacter edaphi]